MAVIEELVSKLGFEVEGLAKLKAAAKEFDKTKKAVVASSSPLKSAGASAGIAAVGVGRLGAESKKSSRGVLLLSTAMGGLRRAGAAAVSALRTVLAVVIRLAAGLAGLAAGAAAVATGFAIIGAKAALARREMRLAAAEIGTTAQNLETVGNILRGVGFGEGFQDEAKKIIGALDEVAKTVRKGGDEAEEAKKRFKGFGIDNVFNVDPKTGKSRDSAALALDTLNAYKAATDQAAKLRKEADTTKSAKKAAALRKKAIEQDRKNAEFADAAGISGRLKVLLDGLTGKQFAAVANEISRLFPTTSNKQEEARKSVADQAVEAGLKFDALLAGLTERFKDIGVALAASVLPSLNSFLDAVLAFAKRTGIIPETKAEYDARTEKDREARRAEALGSPRTVEEATARAEASQKRFEEEIRKRAERRRLGGEPVIAPQPPQRPDSLPAREPQQPARPLPPRDKDTSAAPARTPTTVIRETQADLPAKLEALRKSLEVDIPAIMRQVSPEVNAGKMQKAAESKVENDQRKYENIGNDQRTVNVTNNLSVADPSGVAAAAAKGILGAISTKGANTSTGALTAP